MRINRGCAKWLFISVVVFLLGAALFVWQHASKHRISPERAALLKAGMTRERAVEIFGAEPGDHSGIGKDEVVTWFVSNGVVRDVMPAQWGIPGNQQIPVQATKDSLKEMFIEEGAKTMFGNVKVETWLSNECFVSIVFDDNKVFASLIGERAAQETLLSRLRRLIGL